MIEPTDEMVQLVYEQIDFVNHGDDGIREGLAAALAIFVRCIEGKHDTGLCDCNDTDDPPISPRTGEPMDHHCDCRAVETAAVLLGARTETQHAKACACGPP